MIEYWDKEIETMPQDKIKELQLKLFNQQLERANKTPAYQGKLPPKINSLDEIKNLPFTCKDDLRQNFPYGFLAVSQDEIIHFHASSGSTGKPTLSFFTRKDLNDKEQYEARLFWMGGLRPKHTFQIMAGLGLCTAGWCAYRGGTTIGASVIPVGPGNTKRQIDLMQQLNTNICFSTPGYFQHLLSSIKNDQINSISLKTAFLGGEPLSLEFQKKVKDIYGIDIFNFYGMTEVGSHIAAECSYHNGLHVVEDQFYCEIINPDTGKLVPDGEYGELVVTPLQQEAMPLIRYRTRDITRFLPGDCPCGRTHRRIEPITHRIDDMMIINGVNVFPTQIEECIYKHLTTATNYLIHIKEKDGLKKLVIDIELPCEQLENLVEMKKLEHELTQTLKSYITVTPRLNFIPIGTLPEIQGKAKRFVKDTE